MARWKIINSRTTEELGISEGSPDSEGFIVIDLSKIPKELTIENVIEFAEKEGIIIQDSI